MTGVTNLEIAEVIGVVLLIAILREPLFWKAIKWYIKVRIAKRAWKDGE